MMVKYFIPFLVTATMISSNILADEQVSPATVQQLDSDAPDTSVSDPLDALIDKANDLAKKGDLGAALSEVNKVIEKDPTSVRSYKIRSHIYFAQKQYNSALADANKIVELAPESPIGYVDRAGVYLALENFEKALQDVDHALELKPNSAYAMMLKATILDSQKKQPRKMPFLIKDLGGKIKK